MERVSAAATRAGLHDLTGTSDWQTVSLEFEVREDLRDVELILELRARTGTAWFDRDSLHLKRKAVP